MVRLYLLLVAACAARGAPPPMVGFARNTATFDVFYWLQVTNYGVLYVLFNSPPSGSNPVDIWDLCLHVQMASPNYFVATVLATSPPREQAEKAVLMTTTRTDSTRAHEGLTFRNCTHQLLAFIQAPRESQARRQYRNSAGRSSRGA